MKTVEVAKGSIVGNDNNDAEQEGPRRTHSAEITSGAPRETVTVRVESATGLKIDGVDYETPIGPPLPVAECERRHSKWWYVLEKNGDAECRHCGRKWHIELLLGEFPNVAKDRLLGQAK